VGQFNENDPLQQNLCGAGEACLWYSWQKSADETSFIRQSDTNPQPNIILMDIQRITIQNYFGLPETEFTQKETPLDYTKIFQH
jgi:hypothetical protein